ncbi:hypothetical protein [Natrinema limicola]|uniref:DUF559 domain-containing protein n=1 Tax=Natrinema limicola JCM 13563 TaxID=1230457 RepID=M0C4E6_9EURY|nr:hypothetical protein [Natrinema limicola]ELZ17523.1 hypothetical protein C476_15463 [Natrinema limicola JCM 13563]
MVKIDPSGDPELKAVFEGIKGKIVNSEEEYRRFVQKNPLPEGYVWCRSPFTGKGKWKVTHKKAPDISTTDTGLEQDLRSLLQTWGLWNHFEQDVRILGRQLDFADRQNKVVLEPGAVYWHTPDGCEGEALAAIGEHPEEVYSPPTESDIQKQRTLEEAGWQVLWITENAVSNDAEAIKDWLEETAVL